MESVNDIFQFQLLVVMQATWKGKRLVVIPALAGGGGIHG